jgi:hypothetical protein
MHIRKRKRAGKPALNFEVFPADRHILQEYYNIEMWSTSIKSAFGIEPDLQFPICIYTHRHLQCGRYYP